MPNAVSLFAQATERRPEPFRDAWRTGSFVTPPASHRDGAIRPEKAEYPHLLSPNLD